MWQDLCFRHNLFRFFQSCIFLILGQTVFTPSLFFFFFKDEEKKYRIFPIQENHLSEFTKLFWQSSCHQLKKKEKRVGVRKKRRKKRNEKEEGRQREKEWREHQWGSLKKGHLKGALNYSKNKNKTKQSLLQIVKGSVTCVMEEMKYYQLSFEEISRKSFNFTNWKLKMGFTNKILVVLNP